MLIDPPLRVISDEERAIGREHKFDPEGLLPRQERPGVYTGHLNCEDGFVEGSVSHINDPWAHEQRQVYDQAFSAAQATGDHDRLHEVMQGGREVFGLNGVADTVEQVLAHHQNQVDDPEKEYVLVVTPILRKHQPARGGWRWHKWGEYIGAHEVTREHLYDQPEIDFVLVYSLYRARSAAVQKAF